MPKTYYETIIIGGGISGLACARTLNDANHTDFALITPEIGGRHSSTQAQSSLIQKLTTIYNSSETTTSPAWKIALYLGNTRQRRF